FDGLIDDVRVSSRSLELEELLFSGEDRAEGVIAYWQFEPDPGLLKSSAGETLQWIVGDDDSITVNPQREAFVDWCHLLLNSNEFLYRP
ncbi:MAG: hypothetical protein AAF802_25775, partial [Planctomycetota bacterium]